MIIGYAGLPDHILRAIAFTAFLGTFIAAVLAIRASLRKGGRS